MRTFYASVVPALWTAWCVYWWVVARDTKRTRRKESAVSVAGHMLPLLCAVLLLALPRLPAGFLMGRVLPETPWVFWVGVAIAGAGLMFTVWARVRLGRNWSGIVTLKEGHQLVRSGPYRFVRHPIYSGLLLAIAGSAVARGEWRGIVAFALALAALWRKLRLEERWMSEMFGDEYAAYRAQVAALIPYIL